MNLATIQSENRNLKQERDTLAQNFDKLTKDILLIESEWKFLMKIQVLSPFLSLFFKLIM